MPALTSWKGHAAVIGALGAGLFAVSCATEAPVVPTPAAPPAAAAPPAPSSALAPVASAEPAVAASASAAPAAPPPAEPPRPTPDEILAALPEEGKVDLGNGATLTIGKGDRITIGDPNGKNGGESSCGANGWSYRKGVRLFAELQAALRAGDKEKVASLMRYPLRLNRGVGKHVKVKDAAALLRDFDAAFPPKVVAEALAADPRLVFCRFDGFMLGHGVIWADADQKGRHAVFVINQ